MFISSRTKQHFYEITVTNIQLRFPYQLHRGKDAHSVKLNISIKHSIGKSHYWAYNWLIIRRKNQIYNPEYMEKFSDRFGEYEKFGGLVIAFSPRSIDWNEEIVYGLIYDPEQKKWKYDSAPIPSTLYRRNFHQNKESIEQLIETTDNQLFNSYHFKKSDLYLLQEDPQMNKHLPETHFLKNVDQLIEFIKDKQKIILKPVSLSRGRGIFIIEKNRGGKRRIYFI